MPQISGGLRTAVATVNLDLLNKVMTENEYRYDNLLGQ
jgi:hypothetical protein